MRRRDRDAREHGQPGHHQQIRLDARGLFELKYFFTSAIAASRGGDAHSAEAVRFRHSQPDRREPSNGTLSDERIVELLQEDGVDIARRTGGQIPGSHADSLLGSSAAARRC